MECERLVLTVTVLDGTERTLSTWIYGTSAQIQSNRTRLSHSEGIDTVYMNLELHKRVGEERRQDMLRDIAIWRLLHQGKPHQRTWLVRQGCWVLCQLGRWLVRVGQQLQSAGVYRQDLLTS